MILADESVLFGEVRRAGEREGLDITPELFDDIHREITGEPGAAPDVLGRTELSGAGLVHDHDDDDAVPRAPAEPDPGAEARTLCRNLILADRTVRYRDVQRAAEGLGLSVSKALFASVHRELASRVRGEDVEGPARVERPVVEAGLANLRQGTSALDFAVEFLTTRPQATYAELRTQGEAAGHRIVPITFGRARALAGLPSTTRAPSAATEFLNAFIRERPQASYSEAKAAAAQAGHEIHPVTYGRARQLAGLPRQSARLGDATGGRESGAKDPAIRFMVEYLGAHREANFQEVKTAAADAGFTIYPITYGNARRLAGFEKVAPRRLAIARSDAPAESMDRMHESGPARERRAPAGDFAGRIPSAAPGALSMLDELGQMLERLERQRALLRETLDGIARAAQECLEQLDA